MLKLSNRSLYPQCREQSLWLSVVSAPDLRNTLERHLTFRNTLIMRGDVTFRHLGSHSLVLPQGYANELFTQCILSSLPFEEVLKERRENGSSRISTSQSPQVII